MCLTPSVPDTGQVGGQYENLVQQFAQGIPTQLGIQEQYQPGFVQSGLASTSQGLFGLNNQPGLLQDYTSAIFPVAGAANLANTVAQEGAVGNVGQLGSTAANAVESINPQQTALTRALTQTATQQLQAGTAIDPTTRNAITQSVTGNWAARGLADSNPAQLDQALQDFTASQNLLGQREAAAGSTIAQNQQNITLPALGLTTTQSSAPGQTGGLLSGSSSLGTSAGPSLIPTAQLSDVLSTIYNAQASAQIAGANNTAALAGGALSY